MCNFCHVLSNIQVDWTGADTATASNATLRFKFLRIDLEFAAKTVAIAFVLPITWVMPRSVQGKMVELAGIQDILTKSLGTNNPFNVVRATFEGLKQLKSWEEMQQLRA